jgi:hypothetical protein
MDDPSRSNFAIKSGYKISFQLVEAKALFFTNASAHFEVCAIACFDKQFYSTPS